jgi:ribose 5-phosphate isomerase B
MKIIIGSDHAGFTYKREIIAQLRAKDITVVDVGTDSEAPVSSIPFAREVAEGVASGKFERGILVGGSGNGEAMAANRHKGVRCALCWNADSAKLARQQQDANVLALGERLLDLRTTLAILEAFLNTAFDEIRFEERVAELDA